MVNTIKADDGTTFKTDGYRLRMVMLQWYLFFYYKGKYTGFASGPQSYSEAQAEALERNLPDIDRE